MVGFASRRSRRSIASDAGAGHLRTLGLVTYPFYLTHNVVGAGAARMLIATGLDAGLSICIALSGLLALCWIFCVKVEPAIRALLRQVLAYLGLRYREQTTGSAIMRGLEGPA
jgi:peptidoglycan/LPS O-acetylase OafA/YrhL